MARISFEEWKKQNGRNQATDSAVNNNQTISQPVQSGRMSFEEWKANGRPTFTTARRTAGIAQNNPYNNNLRVLSRGFNQTPTITQAVNQFSYNARKAIQSGPINVKDWNKQYEGFMKYLDDYGSQMNGTEVAMLKAKLKNTYDQLNPKKVEIPTYSKLGNITFDTQNLTTQPRQNMPTYNGGNPFANPSAMAVQNSSLGRLNNLANEKIANDARLREDAYMRGIGASNNANTDRELQTLQNLYKNAQESRYKQTGSLGNYGPNAAETPIYKDLRTAGETYDPTRSNPAAPGKDDGEDFWQKYERIQREHPEFTEDQIYDYIENEPRANYTPVQKSPLADDSIFTRANNAINTELENRSFLREYAPNYLNEDFKQNSQYNKQFGWQGNVPEVGTQAARGPLGGSLTDDEYARMFYESVNGNQAATDYLTKVKDPETGELLEYDYGQQQYMFDGKNKSVLAEALQDDERGMFNYLYATQGADAAMKYYEGLLPALNQRWTAAYNEELQEKMKDPGLAILYNAFTTATKPITAIASVANQVYDLAKNGKIDANDPKYAMLNGANLVRAATSKAINNDVLSFLYEGAMSTIDNIYGTMLGSKIADVFGIAGNAANKVTEGIVLGLMTTDAAQASVLSNIQSGMDTTSAITNGLMSGAIEFITEKIGLDNFFNSMWYGKEKWISLAKQILSEGGEEVVGNTMDDAWGMLYDRLTGLSTSDWRREMNAYILENGLAPDDELTAFNAVFEQHLLDTAKAGLMGGFSGGIMGGFGMGRGAVELNSQVGNIMPANISFSSADSSAPANVRLADIDQVQGLIEEGLSYEPTTKAYKKAAKLQTMLDTGTVTDSQAIDLYKELVKADVTNESHATPELSSVDRSGETRPQTAFPMQGPSVNVPGVTAQKFVPQELYLAALMNATEQDNTTTGSTGIEAGEAEALISDIFNAGLEGEMTDDLAARARAFLDSGYTEAIYQAGVQARNGDRRTAFGPTINMPEQEAAQRDQLIEDVASGYDSAGRTSMGEVMRAFNPFKGQTETDMSTADYVSEISAVYNAAAQNQEIPRTPHLSWQAAQAAINAARMDRIYLDEGITSAEQAEMEAPEETNAAIKPAEYTPVEKTTEQRDTDYENVLDYAGEVATAGGQETFGNVVANNYYDDMDANAYTEGAQAILEQAQQGVPLEDVTLPAQAQKFISPELKAELYNAVNTQEALGNAANTQEVTNGTEESGNVPVPGSSGRVNSTDTGIESEAVAGRTGQTETAGSTVNVRPDVRNAFHLTGQTATAKSLGIETGTETNTVQIVELDDTEENNQLREIATAAHKKLVTFVGNNLSTGAGDARGIIKGDTIYVRADHPRFTPLQIAKHEVMHGELRNDTNHKINSVLNHLRSLFGENFVDSRLIPAYKSRYAASGLSDLRVLEELICDIYGEMNEWNMKDLPGMEEAYNRFLSKGAQITHEIVRNINQTAEAVTEVRNNGPPTEAAMEAAKGGYFGGWYNDGVNVDAEAQIVADDVLAGKTAKDVTYGRQDINPEEVQASRKTNRSHQRMSTEADQNSSETLTSKVQEDVAADLKKRVSQLEKKAEYFKGQTQLSALTPGSAAWKNMKPLINEYGARKILRSVQDFYGSTADIKGMVPEIQRLVTLLATRPDANTFDDVNHLILPIAKQLIENTQVIVEDDGSEILKDIRKTTIKVNPRVQHDIADYNKWRMAHFGKMNLSTNKGTDVTEYYNELTERFGEAAFPSDINTATDQLMYIADFVDNYQPVTQNPYSYDMAALTQDAALTLYNEMLNADLFKPTYADRQNARIEKLQQESTERVQEVRRQARQQRDDQIQKIKDHAKEVAARRRARKEEQNARQKLIRLARRLNSMKTTKANRALIEELIGNLDTVAYSLTEGKAANLMELNAWYETQKETNPDFVAHADLVQKQLARLKQSHISDMTVSEILDLTKSLMTLENDIRTQNKLINTKMNEDALQAGIKAIRDIDNARGIDKGLRRTIDNLIVQGTLSPTRFMHRLTGYNDSDPLYQAVAGEDGLAGGQRKMLDYQYRAGKLFEEWLSDRKFTRWFTGTKAEILSYDIVTADGQQRTIQMTPAMRTTLYLAAMDKGWMQHMCGRDTMDGHIAGGGIVLPDIKSYRKGNISDAYDSGTVKVKITKSFLDKLAQDMSEQELKFAEAIHGYFNGMSKNEINAVSELLLGRSIAEVGDYLPISVDKNFLGAEYGAIKYDGTIEGMGNLKERQASKKPVIVRDITDILKQSIESTSKYVGLAIPIRNFNKIMGVTVGHTDENGVYQNFEGSVLESIANKWGKKAQTYIENMVSDLQTPNNSQEDLEKMFAKIRSKYAGAVLTLNASVALKQAASYPTAAAVLGWKPLMQAFQNPGHVDLDFIAKWTPLQWYRTKGFSTTELGDIQNQNNIFANMPKGLNWIQGMDLITTRKLWKAAEYYVRDNNPELYKKGAGERGQSDAFYRAVADIYNKTIEETQPNYTALQRPEYLRSKSGLVRTLMMFKTQPMQNFNVIYDAVGDFQAKRAQYRNNSDSAEAQQAYEESGKRLRRAVTSQIGQLITFAAMTMLWNMFRRKKEKYTDEEGNVSLEKIAESMGKDIGSGVFGMVPFGSEVWSFISSKIFGDKYYGFESVTDSAISDFLNAGSSAWELIGKIIEDDEPFNITTYKKKLKTVLSSASKIMGVPFDNLYNTVTAGYMRGRDLVDGLFNGNKNLADYWALSWTEDASKDKAEFFDILYNAHMDGKEGEYEEILQLMIDSGEYGDKPEETIADGLQDAFIKHTTHVKGEPDSDAKYRFYDYMYKHQEDAGYEKLHEDALFFGFTEDDIEKGIRNSLAAELIGIPSKEFNKDGLYGHLYSIFDTPEYKEKHDTLTANGWTEDEITDGLKKAYGVQLTGIDSSDYKNADLFTYLYDMKQTNSAGYTAATKEMKKIGYTDDNITDGMKKAYGMQVTGVTEEYSTAVLFDYLYDLKKNHVSNYNAELTNMKGVGFTEKNISDGMKDAYGRAVTGLGSDYTAEALYTTVYKNNKSNLSGKVSEMEGFGFSEQSIRDGLKQAYGASATGKAYKDLRMDDVYDYIYDLYSNNSTRFASEYQAMLNVGFTEKAIKDGIEDRMKAAYGVDNVRKLPHRFAAPDHTLPSYWTYKNDEKDTGPLKEEGYANGSSWISNISYDNGELTVYEHGRPYTYHGVSEEAYENFKNEGYRGAALNKYIKGKYSYN